jgi:tetratricopeptide (TPR) repeat protein
MFGRPAYHKLCPGKRIQELSMPSQSLTCFRRSTLGAVLFARRRALGFVVAFFLLQCICCMAASGQEAEWKELTEQVEDLYQQGRYGEAIPIAEEAVRVAKTTFGNEDPNLAISLNDLAELYEAQGPYEKAEPLFEQALAIREKKSGPNDPDVAQTLNDLAVLYDREGRYLEAEQFLQKALTIRQKTLGPTDPYVALSLTDLAGLYAQQNLNVKAEQLLKQARAIWKNRKLLNQPDATRTLNNLAALYQMEGRYKEAEPLFKETLARREKALGPTHPYVAMALSSLAALYEEEGRFTEAEPLYKQSLAILQSGAGPNSQSDIDVAWLLSSLAELYQAEGRYLEAEPLLKQALSKRQETLEQNHPDVASSMSQLASLYLTEGHYGEAEPLLKQALAIDQGALPAGHPQIATDLNNLGELYRRQGRYEEAEPLFTQALAFRQGSQLSKPSDMADALNSLAELYRDEGQYEKVELLLKQALTILQKSLGPEHPEVALALNNLAESLIEQGLYSDAEQQLNTALKIDRKDLGSDHPDYSLSLNNLAQLYAVQGRYADAQRLFQQALAIAQKTLGPNHPATRTRLINLAELYYGLGKPREAESYFEPAFKSLAVQFEEQFAYMSEKNRLEFLSTVSHIFPNYVSFASTYFTQEPELAGRVYDLLLWQKGLVAQSVAAQRARLINSGNIEALSLFDQLTAKRNRYAALSASPPHDLVQWRKNLSQVQQEANDLEEQLVRRSAVFAESKRLSRPSWLDVQKALGQTEAAIEIVHIADYQGKNATKEGKYFALVLTAANNSGPRLIDLGDATALTETLREGYYKYIAASRGGAAPESQTTNSSAQANDSLAFYFLFWKPLLSALGDAQRIYISTDGELNQVNLGLMHTPGGELLMEKYDVRLLNSTADLLQGVGAQTNQTAVLFANPYFDIPEDEYRKALANIGTQKQDFSASSVPSLAGSGVLGGSVPLNQAETAILQAGIEKELIPLLNKSGWVVEPHFENDALVEAVERVQGPRLLHIGTHGDFLTDPAIKPPGLGEGNNSPPPVISDPMLRSRLYFAGADHTLAHEPWPLDLSDGILTAYQASTLNLHGTELVVLSACDTGRGDVQDGEGVFGLRRALQEAGAESVLMTLWEVPAPQTQELLTNFYQHWIGEGMDKHEALQKAEEDEREKLRQDPDTGDSPYYWGAFILVGR